VNTMDLDVMVRALAMAVVTLSKEDTGLSFTVMR